MRPRHLLTIVLAVVLALSAQAQRQERLLIPLSNDDLLGAYGSVWRSFVWARNDSDHQVLIFPLRATEFFLPPHHTSLLPVFPLLPQQGPGQLLTVEDATATNFSVTVENDRGVGPVVHVPAVWVSQFQEKIQLLDVVFSPLERVHLRIYREQHAEAGPATVRIDELQTGTNQPLELTVPLAPYAPNDAFPDWAEITNLERLPGLNIPSRQRIEVTIPGGGWAFVTATDNATQTVRVVLPQPQPYKECQ